MDLMAHQLVDSSSLLLVKAICRDQISPLHTSTNQLTMLTNRIYFNIILKLDMGFLLLSHDLTSQHDSVFLVTDISSRYTGDNTFNSSDG